MIDNRNPNDVMMLDVEAYQNDTKHMSALQSGAVILLLMEFARSGQLPKEDYLLAEVTKMPLSQWLAHRDAIMGVASHPLKYVQIGAAQ